MKRHHSSDEHGHAEWSENLPDVQAKTAPAIQVPAILKGIPPQMTTGQAIVFAFTFVVPALFFMVFDYQLYFFAVTHTQSLTVAGVLTPVCIFLLLKRRAKAKQKYLVPPIKGTMSVLAGIVLVPFSLLYGWLLMLFSAALLLPGTALDSKVYAVKEVTTSSVKGFHCRPEMTLKGWPGLTDADFCAEDFTPPLKVGEPVVVRGYFSKRAVYVLSVSRPS